ncbi:MAG: tRNA-specific 2-thiouridylase [Alphaproteobacteria bacterium BRH_c36]|nr:MAG: tRNA-specific 2-thiouridylase [Alphaproteobacteria bacterium BRH_c36]
MNNAAILSKSAAQARPRRIVVAMSGGVDSSVVAALLKRAGHDVIGITLQLYDHGAATSRKGACCAGQDIHDARRVAEALGIPHYVLDYEERFQRAVIDSFADSYVAGETPIPCVNCNTQIKFKDLLETATELGAEVLATGHYIRRRDGERGPILARAEDAERDQSYFLFSTTRQQLDKLWFPLGDLPKSEVRALARELGLVVADKADSQDICFVPSGSYADIIERLKPEALTPGNIVHVDGRVLGSHNGIIHYTVGQRRGLGIACGEPLYVVKLKADANEVVVGPREALATRTVELRDVNWLGDEPLERAAVNGLEIHARIRSTQAPTPAMLHVGRDGRTSVVLHEATDGIATGQACVFYSDGSAQARILGGGWIGATRKDAELPLAS